MPEKKDPASIYASTLSRCERCPNWDTHYHEGDRQVMGCRLVSIDCMNNKGKEKEEQEELDWLS